MRSSLFIPKRINVGYQNREDTYTGKLAYVIYFDEKGKLRKEASWSNWRDKEIPNEIFDNEPTSGFVLNKKVGDYDSGWDHRQVYCRIYDPRNFEFEITIENLLYILENTNSIKGKGLEGDFVYGWSGTELVLIPVDSPDYKASTDYTKIITNNETVKAKDLKVGATYVDKDGAEYIYMGRYDKYIEAYQYTKCGETHVAKKYKDLPNEFHVKYTDIFVNDGLHYWFARQYRYSDSAGTPSAYYFEQFKGMPKKMIKCINEKIVEYYSQLVEMMEGNKKFSPPDSKKFKLIPYTFEQFIEILDLDRENWGNDAYRRGFYSDNLLQVIPHRVEDETDCNKYKRNIFKLELELEPGYGSLERSGYVDKLDDSEKIALFKERFNVVTVVEKYYYIEHRKYYTDEMSAEEIFEKVKPCYSETFLQNGRHYEYYLKYDIPKTDGDKTK